MWQKTKTGGKAGFDKLWGFADKLGAPVNRFSNRLGSEAFWPTTLDKESDKAARILRSFCKDGFYEEAPVQVADGPKVKQKVLKKIPAEVIKEAKGLAIFTTMRTGLWISGAGGSGVLVAKLPDGTWSPPSGILLHTAGVGFLVGVDIYDCVLVLNSDEAVQAFSKLRCTLGGEISAVAGPIGVGGVMESEVHKRRAPIFTYLKSRGFYAGVQLDGTIVIERTDENERFYHSRLGVADILNGKIKNPPYEVQRLTQTLKAAQGDTDVDPSMLTLEPPPSDFDVADGQTFGIPSRDDPDPYGVLALEQEGLEIRESGTRQRVDRNSFVFSPSPSSPLFNAFNRDSVDGSLSQRSSWRTTMTDRSAQTVDMSTQTDMDTQSPPIRPHSGNFRASMANIPEVGYASIDYQMKNSTLDQATGPEPQNGVAEPVETAAVDSPQEAELDFDTDDEEAVIHEVQQAASPQFIRASPQKVTKAKLITVTKPAAPALPPRNPIRQRPADSHSPARHVENGPGVPEAVSEHSLATNLDIPAEIHVSSYSSSTYSQLLHDEQSPTMISDSAGSVSSVEHVDISKPHDSGLPPVDSYAETFKPHDGALPLVDSMGPVSPIEHHHDHTVPLSSDSAVSISPIDPTAPLTPHDTGTLPPPAARADKTTAPPTLPNPTKEHVEIAKLAPPPLPLRNLSFANEMPGAFA